jgi:MFS family permease
MTIVICTGLSAVIPVIPNIMREYEVGSSIITLTFTTLLVGRLLSSIFSGYILLKLPPHKLLLISFILHTATMIFLIFARTGFTFALLRFFEGIFEGIVSVTLQVLVIGLSTKEDRGAKMGYLQSSFGVGFILGPLIGSFSMKVFMAKGVFGVTAMLMVLCIIWLTLIYKNISRDLGEIKSQKITFSLSFIRYLPFYSGPILQRILFVAFSMLLPLYLVDNFYLGADKVGYYFTMSAIITTCMMPFTGKLSNYLDANYLVVGAFLIMGFSIFGMGYVGNQDLFIMLFILETFGFAVMAPNAMKIFGDRIANNDRKGEIIGTLSSVREITNILVSLCIIPLYQYDKFFPWVTLSIVCFIASLPYLGTNLLTTSINYLRKGQ